MALKVKNVAAGFWSGGSFHPIRTSGDYDGSFPTLSKPSSARTDKKRKGYKVIRKKVKGKIKEFRVPMKGKATPVPHKRSKGLGRSAEAVAAKARARKLAASKAKAAATRAAKKATAKKATKKSTTRKRNPIPSKFAPAKVRQLPGGDVQILLLK